MLYLLVRLIFILSDTTQQVKHANEAIDTIDKLGKSGPVTLALVVAFGAIVFAVVMMRKNWKLQNDHARELKERERIAKEEADERLREVLAAAKERMESEKTMLREQIEDGQKSTQALKDSARAQEANTRAIEDLRRRFDDFERRLVDIQRELSEARRTQG